MKILEIGIVSTFFFLRTCSVFPTYFLFQIFTPTQYEFIDQFRGCLGLLRFIFFSSVFFGQTVLAPRTLFDEKKMKL